MFKTGLLKITLAVRQLHFLLYGVGKDGRHVIN